MMTCPLRRMIYAKRPLWASAILYVSNLIAIISASSIPLTLDSPQS
jgi:hypothetical protein